VTIKHETPGSHERNMITALSEGVVAKVIPVFHRLASDALLDRCTAGKTQNSNKLLHSIITRKFHKSTTISK
jgi:hypothetical protein